MFSKACEYAIRAMIFIAKRSNEGQRVGIKEIAKAINSPEHFMAKILQDLSRNGLVDSFKGPNGGFSLDKDSTCTLADIVQSIDGNGIFSGCALGLEFCSETQPCPIHHEFKVIRESISQLLHQTKIGQFNEELSKSLAFLKQN